MFANDNSIPIRRKKWTDDELMKAQLQTFMKYTVVSVHFHILRRECQVRFLGQDKRVVCQDNDRVWKFTITEN